MVLLLFFFLKNEREKNNDFFDILWVVYCDWFVENGPTQKFGKINTLELGTICVNFPSNTHVVQTDPSNSLHPKKFTREKARQKIK